MLGLGGALSEDSMHLAKQDNQHPSSALPHDLEPMHDPFAASAGLMPLGDTLSRSASMQEAAAAAAATTPVARETDEWLDDSDSELEADLVFAHVMTRRLTAHDDDASKQQPQRDGASCDEKAGNGDSATAAASSCNRDRAGVILYSHGDLMEGSESEDGMTGLGSAAERTAIDGFDASSSMIGGEQPATIAACQTAEAVCSTSELQQKPEDAQYGTAADTAAPLLQASAAPQDASCSRKNGSTFVQAAALPTAAESLSPADSAGHTKATDAAEAALEAGNKNLSWGRRAKKRLHPSAKAVAAVWELLEKSITRPQAEDTPAGTL